VEITRPAAGDSGGCDYVSTEYLLTSENLMKKTNHFMKPKIGLPLLALGLAIGSLNFLTTASAQQIPALDGINRVGAKHGAQSVQKIVEMKGSQGQSQPAKWRIIAHDPKSETTLREYWIGDTRATNEGANYDYYPKKAPAGFIDIRRLKLGSVAAFKILDREAAEAKIGFDYIDYHLRCREFSNEPIWSLTAKNEDGYEVARVDMSAMDGRVLRTIWTYREGRQFTVRDSALLAPPEPEPLRLDGDDPEEPARPLERKSDYPKPPGKTPEELEPIDPAPIEDPENEVPEVIRIEPIEPEDLPGVDEP
jgi:hypothetical protein